MPQVMLSHSYFVTLYNVHFVFFYCSSGDSIPMISLGLKETKDANFKTVFMVSRETILCEVTDQCNNTQCTLGFFLGWSRVI